MVTLWKPTDAEILAAHGRTIPDVITPGLRVLFCGINPSLYSAAIGHHFGRPGNRFWPTLHASGFTERLLSPFEDRLLLEVGCGITNLVARATATANELTPEDLSHGGRLLRRKVIRYRPAVIAFLGITAFRTAFKRANSSLGEQREGLASSRLWVLPNPSGLNAHYQLADLRKLFGELHRAV